MTDTMVLVGTSKGLFTLRSTDGRGSFELSGPTFPGEEVYATCVDVRGPSPRLFCGSATMHWGPVLRRSDDLGASWTEDEQASVSFPSDADTALDRVWQITPGPASEPDVVYAGVEPAALFRSDDGGRSFSLVRGLWDHPHRTRWEPGGGGLCLHTILTHPDDPDRLLIAISAAGVYLSDDRGETWRASNTGIAVPFLPDAPAPEFGQCVHKVSRDAADPERLYLQHHGGIYRSDDGGGTWSAMTSIAGMDFGFPVVAHPSRPDTAYLLPLESDGFRCTPDGHCIVWRTTDAGKSWEPLTNGLPQDSAYLTILRDGFTTDGSTPAGLYFGTRTGEVYGSVDDGDSWQLLADHLPPVLSVRAAALA
ncbi:MAG: exo-alpha-sialidase [Actinomycetota bacterium]|nr:exo-alpha-sialidase [Actinomycetota bacterium]